MTLEKKKQEMMDQIKKSGLILYPLKVPDNHLERLRFDGSFDEYIKIAKTLDRKIIYLQTYWGLTEETREKFSDLKEDPEIDDSILELVGFTVYFNIGNGDLSIHSFDVGATDLFDNNEETKFDLADDSELFDEKKKKSSEIAKKFIDEKLEYATLKNKSDKMLLIREYLEDNGLDESEYLLDTIFNDANLLIYKKRKKGKQSILS